MAPLAFFVGAYFQSGLNAIPERLKPLLARLAIVAAIILTVLMVGFFILSLPLLIEVWRDRSSGNPAH